MKRYKEVSLWLTKEKNHQKNGNVFHIHGHQRKKEKDFHYDASTQNITLATLAQRQYCGHTQKINKNEIVQSQ